MAVERSTRYSIGEVAEFSGVTVRTLQYYDNIGLVPIEKDESGRRFYSYSDLVRLQQVLFYRSLGLPLKQIRELVVEAAAPEQITEILTKQREIYYKKLNEIHSYISAIDAVLASVGTGGEIHSEELVELMTRLNRGTVAEYRHVEFDAPTKQLLMKEYADGEAALAVYWQWKALILEASALILSGVEPQSEAGKQFAQKWLNMIEQVTQGRSDLLKAHRESYDKRSQWPEDDRRLMEFADQFIDAAVAFYLESERAREKVEDNND
jgi:DNA-binding transcriptional MerR regulator